MSAEENSFNLIDLKNNNNINSENDISMPYNLEAEQSLLGAILFDNTISSNVSYANDNASQEDIRKACELAAADDFILPNFFQKCVKALQFYPECGLICGDAILINPENKLNIGFNLFSKLQPKV